jgi:hypothetical protein
MFRKFPKKTVENILNNFFDNAVPNDPADIQDRWLAINAVALEYEIESITERYFNITEIILV